MAGPRFLFPEAGLRSPDEVRAAVWRFRQLPERVRALKPILYWLLGESTRPFKFSRDDVEYVEHPVNSQRCGSCWHAFHRVVTADKYVCEIVGGEIAPAHWCNRWTATGPRR